MSDFGDEEDEQNYSENSDNEFIVDEDLKEDYKMYENGSLDDDQQE